MIKNKDLESIIKEMELNTYNFNDIYHFRKKLEKIQENFDGKNIYEINDEITFEILFLSYEIQDGTLIPLYSLDENPFPNFSLFNNECINYLEKRFEETKNCLLKSLYSLILWKYCEYKKEKDISYLYCFIESSLKFIHTIQSQQDISSTDYWMMERSLKNAFYISFSIDYEKKDEIKNTILDFIYDDSIKDRYVKKELIKLMLSQEKIFKKNDFEGMDKFCWNLYLREEYGMNKIDFLVVGQSVDNKIQYKNYNWNEEIAKCYEELMDETEDYVIKVDFCIKAILYYRKSKNQEKELDLLNKLEWYNSNLDLRLIKVPINLKPLDIFIDIDLCEKILYCSIEMINYLIYSESSLLINKFNKNRNIYDNLLKNSPILMGASKRYFDSNRNLRKMISSNYYEEEKINDINERVYVMSLEKINKTYLDRLFIFIYENKILSYEDTINFLNNFYNYSIDDERNMLQYLDPLINDYFYQIDILLNDQSDGPMFIMFIDSICSKIEYLLKTICSNNKIIITNVQQDGLTSMVSLKTIFDNEDFKNLINESDFYFLKHVLIEPGLNLRNISAHGLDLSIYNFSNANLLFLCFFRIIKYL